MEQVFEEEILSHSMGVQMAIGQLTAAEGSIEARMGIPPAGTRRPQTPAATGPDMVMVEEKLCAT